MAVVTSIQPDVPWKQFHQASRCGKTEVWTSHPDAECSTPTSVIFVALCFISVGRRVVFSSSRLIFPLWSPSWAKGRVQSLIPSLGGGRLPRKGAGLSGCPEPEAVGIKKMIRYLSHSLKSWLWLQPNRRGIANATALFLCFFSRNGTMLRVDSPFSNTP